VTDLVRYGNNVLLGEASISILRGEIPSWLVEFTFLPPLSATRPSGDTTSSRVKVTGGSFSILVMETSSTTKPSASRTIRNWKNAVCTGLYQSSIRPHPQTATYYDQSFVDYDVTAHVMKLRRKYKIQLHKVHII